MAKQTAKTAGCANCPKMEQKYKDNPRAFWMRLWHWHSGWCPGHKAYKKAEEAKLAGQATKQ
jgi:hypothetical protein